MLNPARWLPSGPESGQVIPFLASDLGDGCEVAQRQLVVDRATASPPRRRIGDLASHRRTFDRRNAKLNPIRTGRMIWFLLPYVLLLAGLCAAGKLAGTPGGTVPALQALGIAAAGALWAAVRARKGHG